MEERLRKYVNRKFRIYPKTHDIVELREELFSMMCDKYEDCVKSGMSKEKSYKAALSFMDDYRLAVREVETGSALAILKRKILGTLSFSVFYLLILSGIYLYISMVALKSFDSTWLIGVGGVFAFLIYIAGSIISYAKMFQMPQLCRSGVAFLFLSLIPLLYVFPSLLMDELFRHPVWAYSWLLVPIIVFLWSAADLMIFGSSLKKRALALQWLFAGFVLSTCIYLCVSAIYELWSVAWIIYLAYFAAIALAVFISKTKKADN